MSLSRKTLAGMLVAGSLSLGLAHAAPGPSHHGHGSSMMRLRGLDLTEAQRDQVFRIYHDQSPAMREQMKQMRKARAELTEAAGADRYDAERVRAAAEAQGKATTQLALLRAQTIQRVHDVLTPEQRAKLKERLERHHK
jgi:periplasmic protein CpxP/Spy